MPLTSALAHRVGAMDDTRKPAVPRIGGVAMALGGTTALLLVGVVFTPTGLTLLATSRSLGPVLLGTLAILIMLFMPRGVWGAAARRWQWQLFPTQRWLGRSG